MPGLVRPKEGELIKITNARILRNNKLEEDGTLWFLDGRIVDSEKHFWDGRMNPTRVIDAERRIVSPGFLDLQINGAFGVDFTSDPAEELSSGSLERVRRGLLRQGCTGICPTLVSSRSAVYEDRRQVITPQPGTLEHGAAIIGLHLEGPFISDDKSGAHEVATLQESVHGFRGLEAVYGPLAIPNNGISIITLAPELPGALEAIPLVVQAGIVLSQGHSMAGIATAEQAVDEGATFITHLFNAMHPFHHRDPGIIGLLGATSLAREHERPYYGIIADGIHSHPNSIRIAYSAHPRGVILVTDAISPMGFPPGEYTLGDMNVTLTAEGATLTGTDTLAGSVISLAQCVRNFRSFTEASIVDSLISVTQRPAYLLDIEDERGTFRDGALADILFLDDELNVERVFIQGQEVDLTEKY